MKSLFAALFALSLLAACGGSEQSVNFDVSTANLCPHPTTPAGYETNDGLPLGISTYVPSMHQAYVFPAGTRFNLTFPLIWQVGLTYHGQWWMLDGGPYYGSFDVTISIDRGSQCYYQYLVQFYNYDGAWVMTGHLADSGGDAFDGSLTNTNGNYWNSVYLTFPVQ